MRGRRILIPLPNTGSMYRKRNTYYMRGIIFMAILIFLFLKLQIFTFYDNHDSVLMEPTNDSVDAIMSMVPSVLHKFLTPKTRNQTLLSNLLHNGSNLIGALNFVDLYHPPNITEINRQIAKYNDMQLVLNEYTFGPLQNDSVIIVVQVHTRITYLRHLIVSLAQAHDISRVLLIFSHDYYDEDINDLVQTIDFCKVMQIFYPYSIQTHPNEFPGIDPNDCPRDIKKDHAIIRKCNNALYPDLYGHYREAKFTQTKHHWWWKANRVFDQLEITRYHTGLVLFLEEDHYVAEDFLYVLEMMYKRTIDLCLQCNILSLGTYLKTFNYYTYNSKSKQKSYSNPYASSSLTSINNLLGYHRNRKSLQLSSQQSSSSNKHFNRYYDNSNNNNNNNNNNNDNKRNNNNNNNNVYVGDTNTINTNTNTLGTSALIINISTTSTTSTTTTTTAKSTSINKNNNINNNNNNNNNNNIKSKNNNNNNNGAQQTWSYHVLPSLYSIYQKVEVMPWISSKHNMGFAFNRTTWNSIRKCAKHFCSYDDYNWDWSLQHVSQQCLRRKLHAMIVKGPRVFHIGECGVHHKKKNCESNQVISKVQQVLRIARKSGQMFPRTLTLTVASLIKKTKLRKGNGGWGDKRDHELCMNMTLPVR
ncbi:alpha-1,6-mannosyl-glycoprotein 2-beta-N-acetylglucosaminyltransferase-like isoform X1 [Glossina fuscipes]|uniref:Alpha-1,6-mannosyl-glycoprotein 2-beta-N-acetylglucosaminyltransferase n=1 Tax=Glossina fuscipes TaxID=7396 RepID=A0A9C5ZAC9_9MUSC|nr:alpha-1,6-mannosyl-glycoprotein 2-beta-N-acetylglucosaminyltransferase-like isoform X1 [Glossina fuscipes]XP_037894949.1 alpha-1,6-mannosyl-glycoprotein 2-beta-N-acetylglucosaminyltransferase-like isoform X1 [Glossina fuscipes]XP_037894950.1 alpha-1,6-mannosyl-glycoprotein 2-beta-N-acetylglucosaminyltransferase-like isoform X1 [Glossina fuscipes]XP_037894951.1 alpha-1,6-mannosyl-glycoprotein 2-beta-N-acetylglucosaminyltransferase-like isoform X1 [Glossina fuscipes]XP_037894952.1 alpha-1,6-ma